MKGETRDAGHPACVRPADRMRFGSPSNCCRSAKRIFSLCFRLVGHTIGDDLLRRLLLRPRGDDRCELQHSHADARREIRDLAARRFWQWPAARRIVVVTREPRMIAGKKSRQIEAVTRLAHLGGAVESVVTLIKHVAAEMATTKQFGVGREHELHEAERSLVGNDMSLAYALGMCERRREWRQNAFDSGGRFMSWRLPSYYQARPSREPSLASDALAVSVG
jgi:hypothetical protein